MPFRMGMTGALLTDTEPKTTLGVIVPVSQECKLRCVRLLSGKRAWSFPSAP